MNKGFRLGNSREAARGNERERIAPQWNHKGSHKSSQGDGRGGASAGFISVEGWRPINCLAGCRK